MAKNHTHKSKPPTHNCTALQSETPKPFESAQELWFWFITAQQARNDGARYVSGMGKIARPCEPVDIIKILDTLYRKRRLLRDHLLVLRYYGRRHLAPDPNRVKERRAHALWVEAFERLEPILEKKGLIEEQSWTTKFHPCGYDHINHSGQESWA